ncbi:MAG: S-layer homology domain-containing protein, partial [Thermoanaerobaculia bacterium]
MLAALCASVVVAQTVPKGKLLPTTRHAPDEFGTQDYTVTTISATSFTPGSNRESAVDHLYETYGNKARYFRTFGGNGCLQSGELGELYATVNIPSGAVIDFIGLETTSPFGFAWGVSLYLVDQSGTRTTIGSFSSTQHNNFASDYNASPLGFQLGQNVHNALVLNVEGAGNGNGAFPCPLFSWVEIWWKRAVSPAPATASFNDVPTSHPFFQYIEALKASGITGGCQASPPLYCPNNPVTRGQMAVFLAKA